MFHVDIYVVSAAAGVIALLWEAWRNFRNRHNEGVEDIARKLLNPLILRLTVLETKMERTISDIALLSATVLHHPEPSRVRVDQLLDFFRDGNITAEEIDELKGYLSIIVHWEEDDEAPFKVFQGEQSAAALMLATIDHVVGEVE